MAKKTSLRSAAKQKKTQSNTNDKKETGKSALSSNDLKKRVNAEIPLDLHNRFKSKMLDRGQGNERRPYRAY